MVSALDDRLQTIKTYLMNAAPLSKGCLGTAMSAISGWCHCWSVLSVVNRGTLGYILDWFHIGKKFQRDQSNSGEAAWHSLLVQMETLAWRS